MPTLEEALSEAMRGSLSNELDEQTFNGAAGELNGLFTQATDVAAASAVETYATGIARFAALVDGRHAYDLSDLRAVIGSKTFALYAGIFSGNGDVSLFDYLTRILGSIRVSDRVPAVASTAQKGIVVLSASSTPPKIHVWDSLDLIRDPYSGAGVGKVTLVASAFGLAALHSARYEPGDRSPPEALVMALRLLLSPGCQPLSEEFIERSRRPGELVIDAGEIFKALTGTTEIPSKNVPALRLALGLRATAIRHCAGGTTSTRSSARATANRAALKRLQEQAGPGTPVLVHQIDRDEACKRIDALIKGADRRVACREGLSRDTTIASYLEPDDHLVK